MSSKPLQKLLLVEDDPDLQLICHYALVRLGGFSLEIASSGEEGLAKMRVFQPDLILMDVMMDDMDGPSTLKALQEDPTLASIPVIFLTAKALPEDKECLKSLGAWEVIAKLFDPLTLANRLRELWENKAS